MKELKGLTCSIMGTDCTAGGVTSGHKTALLIGDGISGPFGQTDDTPTLVLEYDLDPQGARAGQLSVANVSWIRALMGKGDWETGVSTFECMGEDWASKHRIVNVVARPLGPDGKPRTGGMFGGHYIKTSDSRWPVTSPIPVHDRFEY